MRSDRTLSSALSHLACVLRSTSPFVWLVAGDGQHMAHLWDKACPAESIGPLRVVQHVQDARLRCGGAVGGVVTGGRYSASASVSMLFAISFV